VEIIYESWRFLQKNGRITLYGYVIVENHLHWIASAPNLSKEAGDFKSFTARQIIDYLKVRNIQPLLGQLAYYKLPHKDGQRYQLWQDGHHPQQILSEDMMRQKLEYIHNNPIKRGYVDEAVAWRYSSARNYVGRPGLIDVTTAW
jgi:putative transposase